MDGLKFKFDDLLVQHASEDVALKLREKAHEVIPLRPDGASFDDIIYSDTGDAIDPGNHSFATHDGSGHPIHTQTASGSFSPQYLPRDDDIYGSANLQDTNMYLEVEGGGNHEDSFDQHGGKRFGEALGGPSPKQRKGSSPRASLGFGSYVTSGAVDTFLEQPSCSLPLTGSAMSSASSSSCPVSFSSGSDLPDFADRIVNRSYLSGVGSSLRLDSLTPSHLQDIAAVASLRVSRGDADFSTSPFLPPRAGHPVPSQVSEFKKGLGSCYYVPPSTIRIRDDGQDPVHARSILDAMIPPLLSAEASQQDVFELARLHDVHTLNSVAYGVELRRAAFDKIGLLARDVENLESAISSRNSSIECISTDLEKEKFVSSTLRGEKEKLDTEVVSLKSTLEESDREREEMKKKILDLEGKVHFLEVALNHKEEDTKSLRERVGGLSDELGTSADDINRLRSLLACFPEFFKEVLEHPDVKGPFGDFNDAAIYFGQQDGAFQNMAPSALDRVNAYKVLRAADEVWKDKAFPILGRVASMPSSLR